MAALRHLLVGVTALLALVGAGAWLVPPLLDWSQYRDEVAALASRALGRTVRIDGRVALRLLPQPELVAGRVTVEQDAVGAQMTAEALQLRVALGPLLGGRVDAQALVLRRADIRLPWPLDPAALATPRPAWLAALSARLVDGRLRLGEVEVTGIDATLSTSDLSGTFFSAGRARSGGREWVFTARLTPPGGDGAVGVDVTLDGQGVVQGVGVTMAGQVQADGTLLGRIAVRGPDLSRLLPAPVVPFSAEGRLSVAGGLVAADALTGEIAGSPMQGAVALRLAPQLRLDVALAASRLDLDGWGAALLAAGPGVAGRLPVGIDLSAEAAPLAGGTLRGLRGAFDLGPDGVAVREARAVLPGDAQLALSGRIVPGADRRPGFSGRAALRAPALRATLDWLAGAGLLPALALPPGVLRGAELEGGVAVEAGRIAVAGLTGRIDGTRVAGDLSLRPGTRPELAVTAVLDRVALDPWLPDSGGLQVPGPAELVLATARFGLDLRLDIGSAVLRGVTAAPLRLTMASGPGRLTLGRLELGVAGAEVAASGAVLEGGRIADGRLELRAADGAGLATLLPEAAAAWLGRGPGLLRGTLGLQVQAAGPMEALVLRIAGELGDLRLEAMPTLDLGAGRWAGTLALRHPGAPRLAERLGLAGAPAWLGDGSFALTANLAGRPGRIAAEGFDLVAGSLRAGGTLALATGAVPRLEGRVVAETLPLPLPYARAPEPLGLALLAGWQAVVRLEAQRVLAAQLHVMDDAAATLRLGEGVLRLEGLVGRIGGGAVAGDATLDAAARPPALAVEVRVEGAALGEPLFDAPLDIAAGVVDATLRLRASGHSPAALLASLAGEVTLSGRDGALAGIDLARMGTELAEAEVRAALAGGATGFDRIEIAARIAGGGLVLERAALAGPAGTVTASGSFDLTRAAAALRLAAVPAVQDAPEIGLRLSGPLDALERVPELGALARWRAGR